MRPSHNLLPKAFALFTLAGLLAASPAFAQYYDSALGSLGLVTDVSSSPRLLGMGGLSLSVPDRHQRLTLWDFAGSPVGAYEADSSSALELRPGSGSASGAHQGSTGREREDLAGRATGTAFELFNRDENGNAWGAIGNLRSIRQDNLYDQTTETRRTVSYPEVTPILAGPFPYWGKGKLHYAARVIFGNEQQKDQYREIVTNAAGEFISLDGTKIGPPGQFDPVEWTARRTGFGVAASYPAGKHATVALGYDATSTRLEGLNDGARSVSQVLESRPYGTLQAAIVGKLGKSFEYGLDERHWSANSQQDWHVSFSSGIGQIPLQGSGKLLDRKETGNAFNSRFSWMHGNMRLAGQYWTYTTRADFTPPPSGDPGSFNLFLSNLYYRLGADTLSLPDSVSANREQNNSFGYAAGVSWKLRRGIVGLEYHRGRETLGSTLSGTGPKAVAYDVRAGLEYECSPIVTGRIGAGMLWRDPDTFVSDDRWKGESASLGLGLKPPGASWSVELGWTMTWLRTDYPDPLLYRASHQQLQSLLHWTF